MGTQGTFASHFPKLGFRSIETEWVGEWVGEILGETNKRQDGGT